MRVLALLSLLTASTTLGAPTQGFDRFITAKGDQLFDGDQPFRFVSWNIPNLHLVEDNLAFSAASPWRWPDSFEIMDALGSVRQIGGQVVRTYVISVRRAQDAPSEPRHVLGPRKFNEEGFRALDRVLQIANEQQVRLIIPFVDNWSWWGGRADYAAFHGKGKDAFWTDPQVIADFKETVRFVVMRTNTFTGVPYHQDKAILCWETGNELESPAGWTREIAAFVKSLDPNHLVMDGFHTTKLRDESLAMPEVDIVTTHHYPGGKETFAQLIRENQARAKGKKPYIVGEMGFVPTSQILEAIDALVESGASGGLLWSLRFRNRDGGFYWHSEPSGGNLYKAFHWPGSPIADDYDETKLMGLVREKAFQIRGLAAPGTSRPVAPVLLPVVEPPFLSWQGTAGAGLYDVERSASKDGEWKTIAENVDDSFVQYRPLFCDETAGAGSWYYRVRARNAAGVSEPSNIIGPVRAKHSVMVDEFADFSRVHERKGILEIARRDCRQAMEDAHRVRGQAGSSLVYRLPKPLTGFRVMAFFPKGISDLRFAVSADGSTFTDIPPRRLVRPQSPGADYTYWPPIVFEVDGLKTGARFLRIEFTGETQVGRVEFFLQPD
jgi:hypothetical protein